MAYSVHLGDCKEVLKTLESDSIDALVTDPPAGISFMGKAWDSYESLHHFQEDLTGIFREVLRVLKPGAHGLVWALPRTSMFTGMALIDAGFECRDSVLHLFGTGMPKGQNVSKAIDKAAGATREVLGPSGTHTGGIRKIYAQDEWSRDNAATMGMLKTAPATDEAKQWEGWNTTLKPAHEVWWLVRKPLAEKTVVKQVLATGTGAINVDACRVVTHERITVTGQGFRSGKYSGIAGRGETTLDGQPWEFNASGRWPANAVLSHAAECVEGECQEGCAVAALDEQSGELVSGTRGAHRNTPKFKNAFSPWDSDLNQRTFEGDTGGASRFFYTAKVPPAERKLPDGSTNQHPTAKSIKLMRYFTRLITPPGGTVLDPFAGSGTTGVAALQEGFCFVGVELDPEHHRVAQLRLADAMPKASIFDDMEDL